VGVNRVTSHLAHSDWKGNLFRKEFLGCRTGAGTETRPYRVFIVAGGARFAMMDYSLRVGIWNVLYVQVPRPNIGAAPHSGRYS
jgi:hypothetical protein